MDPLSDVLSLLKLRSYMCGGLDVGGNWSVEFPRHDFIKCYAIVSGGCWLCVEGVPNAVRLGAGDCFLLPPVVHLREESDKAALRWSVERMMQELRDPQPGGFLVAQQLASMILVQALRLHLAGESGNGVGWLFAWQTNK